ncbi:hypothetical protein JB92DRAFT_2896154 [Gautieria morchelliformis]|nr:hypothetical protein JB92DRAFT_2896154 [Gautieria morchelliformis]
MFGMRSSRSRRHHTTTTTSPRHHRRGFFHFVNPNRRAGGLKAALHNPNTSSAGRRGAKHELRMMGRGRETHVPLSVKIKHFLGIRSHHTTRRR